jgi:hypothetical protein
MRFEELTKAVGEWSHRNFGEKQNPYLGLVEELGELAHCLLKREQGIRGYDNPSYFIGEYMDAIGDMCIYAANYAYNEKIVIPWPLVIEPQGITWKYMANACFWLSRFNIVPEVPTDLAHTLNCFLICIGELAAIEGLDIIEVAAKTWKVVSVRDWKANSQDGKI